MMWRRMLALLAFCAVCSNAAARSSRIVGGTPTELGEFPFQASLYYQGRQMCACTVLSADYVLTAAHCAYNYVLSDFTVYAGSNLISEASAYGVTAATLHEGFVSSISYPNDVAVLKVDPPFTFNENLQPVQLPPQGLEFESGQPSIAVGWGMTVSGSPYPDALNKVDLQVFSDDECLAAYFIGPAATNICAGPPLDVGGYGTCGGDTGGALMAEGMQVGISSWQRVPCGQQGFPAVFTQVSLYTDWIVEKAGLTA